MSLVCLTSDSSVHTLSISAELVFVQYSMLLSIPITSHCCSIARCMLQIVNYSLPCDHLFIYCCSDSCNFYSISMRFCTVILRLKAKDEFVRGQNLMTFHPILFQLFSPVLHCQNTPVIRSIKLPQQQELKGEVRS